MNSRERLPQAIPHEVLRRNPDPLIFIMHPALDDILFAFPAYSTGSAATPYGVFPPLVLDACRVLTNHAANCQGDFLALDRAGLNRIPIDDSYMDVHCYYFLGPPNEHEANRNYPVVRTFSAFTLPPVLPDPWSRVAVPLQQPRCRYPVLECYSTEAELLDLVRRRDRTCIITQYPDTAQRAYLIPKMEKAWFDVNHMRKYVHYGAAGDVECKDMDQPSNGMLLRADVHQCLGQNGFVFYPDSSPSPGADGEVFVTYFLGRGWWCLPELFHRRRVAIHPDIPVEFLYARFAYAVINTSLTRDNPLCHVIPEPPTITVVRERIRVKEEEEERQRRRVRRRG